MKDLNDPINQYAFAPFFSIVTPIAFLLFLLISLVYSPAMAGEYFLYSPKPVAADVPFYPGEGVLVQKIIIKRGDTLSDLSQQFAGNWRYFSQILLFNEIRNPNLIYAGKELLVPLSSPRSKQRRLSPFSGRQASSSESNKTSPKQRIVLENNRKNGSAISEKQLFDQAAAFFAQERYRDALAAFDLFLKKYPNSSLVPDASLYRGDCFLRLSGG